MIHSLNYGGRSAVYDTLFKRVRTITVKQSVMYCSCHMFERFGIPCRHMFAVLDTMPKYKQPSINDVSVIYWKAYSLYCYNDDNNDEKSLKLGQLLADLRSKDIKGPTCPKSWYKSIPICTILNPTYIQKGIVCRNYNTEEVNKLKCVLNIPSGYGVSMSLSQDYENSICETPFEYSFAENSKSDHIDRELSKKNTKKNVYAELFPIFKELVQHMQSGDQTDVARVKAMLTSELNHAKVRHVVNTKTTITSNTPTGKFISCHKDHVKRRKTHGTNYYKK